MHCTVTIDWTRREKFFIKRYLWNSLYPLAEQQKTIETVLQRVEVLSAQ